MENKTKDQQPVVKQAWQAPQIINLQTVETESKVFNTFEITFTSSYGPS